MASEASTSQVYSRTYISNDYLTIQPPELPAWDSFYNTSAPPSNTLYDSATSLKRNHDPEIDSDTFPSPPLSPSLSVSGSILKHPYPSTALSPRSRAAWQLSQSEPSLVLGSQEDALDGLEDEDEEHHLRSPTSKKNGKYLVRRRNTLHLDIPVRKVAQIRDVEDEDPVFMQGDSSLETEKPEDEERIAEGSERSQILDTVVIVDHDSDADDERRGRSNLRGAPFWRGDGRANSLPPPKSPDSKANGQSIELRPPIHIACFARRGSECPHGAHCPYVPLVPSDPSTRPPPPKLSACLPPISHDEAVHPLSTSPLLASAIPRSIHARMAEVEGQEDEDATALRIQALRLESPDPPSSLSPSPSPSPDPVRSRPQVLSSVRNVDWEKDNGGWISVRNSGSSSRTRLRPSFPSSTFSFVPRSESLEDPLGLEPHPLMKRFNLLLMASHARDPSLAYSRHKVRRGIGGRKSRDGSELESEEEEEAVRRKRRRRSSAGSMSGKYAVPVIPPYRGKVEETVPSTGTETKETPRVDPSVEEVQSSVAAISIASPTPLRREEPKLDTDTVETRSRPRQLQLSSPPTSPDLSSREMRRRPGETGPSATKLAPSRSLFGLALAPLGKEASMVPEGRPEAKRAPEIPVGTTGSAKGLFSNLYRFPANPPGGRLRERDQDDGNLQTDSSSSLVQQHHKQPGVASPPPPPSAAPQASSTIASPVSPSAASPSTSMHVKSASASSTATSDTIGSSLKPGSALQRAIAVMASLEPERFARLEAERIRRDQKHQQALRLERALESKRALYISQLLGIPVSIQGETPEEVALTDEERQRIEQEVETVEASLIDIRSEIHSYGGIPGRSIPWKECRSRASLEVERSQYNPAPKVTVPIDPSPPLPPPSSSVRPDESPNVEESRPRMPSAKERVMANMALFGRRPTPNREDRDSLPPFVLNSIQSQKDRMRQLVNPDPSSHRDSKAVEHAMERRQSAEEPSSSLGLPFLGTLRPGTLGRPVSAIKPVNGTQNIVMRTSRILDDLLGPLPPRLEKEPPRESNAVKISKSNTMDGVDLLQLIQGQAHGHSNEQVQVPVKTTVVVPKPKAYEPSASSISVSALVSHEAATTNNIVPPEKFAVKVIDKSPPIPADDVKSRRRISMSNALPGEEASSQTMEGLAFDSDEEDADDSREYISAEEGFIEESDQEADNNSRAILSSTPQPQGQVTSVEPQTRPMLQRKRSLTTTDLPPPQAQAGHRPSLLDDWTFNFEPRKPKLAPASPRGLAAILTHRKKLSQGSSVSTPGPRTDAFSLQSTPDSPPPRRPSPSSPTVARFHSLADPPPADYSPYLAEEMTGEGPRESHPSHNAAYHIVTSSANVLDEATNVIEYATARVMSGGVKIGSIVPRGQNGVIQEEEEEEEDEGGDEHFETTESFQKVTNSTAAVPTQVPYPSQPVNSGAPFPVQAISQTPVMPVPQSAPMTTSTLISSAQSNVPGQPPTVIIQKRTIVANNSPGIHSYTNSGSPVTSVNGGQSTPIEYCGDFRTTGHCRFGARCRYSHDIEPRVKSMNTATTIKYRPILRSDPSTHPPNTEMLNPLPPLPPGYQISNIMPQPHHIPGVPLAQQPPSPFVFSTPAAVAHPKTSPAATAAAARGELMADKEKAAKILKSLGLSPHQTVPHQPAPVVLADGEISYNLNTGRSGIFRDITKPLTPLKPSKYAPYIQTKDAETEARETQEMLIARFGPGAAPRMQPPASEEVASTSNRAEEDDDVWQVSAERQRQAVDLSKQVAEPSNRSTPQDLQQQPVEEQRRLYTPAQPPPSYSSAQTVPYPPSLPQPSQYPQAVPHPSVPATAAAYATAVQPAGKQSISVSPEYLAALLTAAQQGISNSASHHPSQVPYVPQPTVYGHVAVPQVPQPQPVLQHPQHVVYQPQLQLPQHQPPFQHPATIPAHLVPQQQPHLPHQHPQMQYPTGAYTNLHRMPF